MCVLVSLAACGPRFQDFQPGLIAPALQDDILVTEDGKKLPFRVWEADGETEAVLLALHGFNMYSNYFDDPAKWWAKQGLTTYAYDQRGFGAAPEARFWGGTAAMAADARAMLDLLARRHPGRPLFILGESMGAAVAVLAMSEPPISKVDGVVLVAPGLWGGKSMHPFLRFSLWLSAHVMPWNTDTGSGLRRRPSDNIPMLRALGRDKLVIRHTRMDAVYGVTMLMGHAYDAAPSLHHPALVLYGERDEIVPARPVHNTMDRLPERPVYVLYPDGWHMLLRDLQAEVVWRDIAAWIKKPGPDLPSGHGREW